MTTEPLYPIARYEDIGNIASTQAVIPVTVHLTARNAARLLVADFGRIAVANMSPAERARALAHAVEERCRIDTTEPDIAQIRDILVGDMHTSATTTAHYDGPTELSSVPSVFDNDDDDRMQPLEPVTG